MKKYLLLLFIASIGLSSCTKEVFVPDDTLPNQTIIAYINPNQWIPSSDGYTLSAEIPVSQIDEDTFFNDDISLMISRNDNNIYEKIPFVYDGQAYSYDVAPGSVKLYIQTSGDNILTPVRPTSRVRVKIVLITSSI